MIHHSLPELRHVIYANIGKPVSGELMHYSYKVPLSKRAVSFVANAARDFVRQSPLTQKVVRLIRSRPAPTTGPSFNYSLFRSDEALLTEIADCLRSHSSLQEVLDTKKCLRFLGNFKAGNFQGQSEGQQTELMGSLASMCLSFKHLDL